MVLRVYVSGMSGNKEVKKRQQRVMMILDSKNIQYEVIDITEPGRESDKEFMQNKATSHGSTVSDPDPRHALPPQIFNSENYCGDYHAFDLANEIDTLEQFLKLAMEDTTSVSNAQLEINQKENGTISLDDELDQNKENEAIEQLAARNGENNNENEEEHEDKNENDVHEKNEIDEKTSNTSDEVIKESNDVHDTQGPITQSPTDGASVDGTEPKDLEKNDQPDINEIPEDTDEDNSKKLPEN